MNYIITGVSKGLGLETATLLLREGHTVFGISRSQTEALKSLQNEFSETLHWLKYDLSNSEDIRDHIFKSWIGLKTPIHGLVNNAAIAYDDIISNAQLAPLEKMYAVNVFSPIIFTKYAIRQMLLHKIKGSIVQISSVSAHTGYKGLSMYASTKGAMEAFSKNTAREWGSVGIRSNAVVPGFMETEMSATLSEEQRDRIFKRTSLKVAVDVQSVAATIAFLLSPAANAITGQLIHVDNGTI
jgi:3-oxoacyl-[acyl-carrier protein] reductase